MSQSEKTLWAYKTRYASADYVMSSEELSQVHVIDGPCAANLRWPEGWQ